MQCLPGPVGLPPDNPPDLPPGDESWPMPAYSVTGCRPATLPRRITGAITNSPSPAPAIVIAALVAVAGACMPTTTTTSTHVLVVRVLSQ